MGAPCRVTFEGKVFFKPDFVKRFLDTLHLEDDVVENSTYLKSIGYDNAFNEGDPMLIREKKAEAKKEGSVGVGGDVKSTTKALEGKDINIGNSIDVFRVGDNKRFASNNQEYLKEFIEDFPERSGDKKIRKEKIIINKPYEVTLSKYEFSDEAIETKIIKKAKKEGYDGVIFKSDFSNDIFYAEIPENKAKALSEAYHKAKSDGSNPELVKAVDELLGKQPQAAAEANIFDDFDTTNKRTGLKGKVEANKAFREKYGEDAAVAKAISSNFEAIADELKAKGIFTKIKC